jgi:4-hydroxy-3-polyprenylbenzoate decarboxylase
MGKKRKIVIAACGSSGAIYAKMLIESIASSSELLEQVHVDLVFTDNAITNWELEIGPFNKSDLPFKCYGKFDYNAGFASGSAGYDTMILCPCSMGMLGRITHGVSNDLISRAADVMLKERGKLILVPRETPLNLIHLRNMTLLTEAGAIICPAIPSFYSNPGDFDQLIRTVTDRVLLLADIDIGSYKWGE